MTNDLFPIRLDQEVKAIPLAMLEAHAAQVAANHSGRPLGQLASMGGLTPEEAVCILEDRPFERMGMTYATLRLMELVQQWKGRNTPVFQAPPISTRLEHALGLVQRLRDGRAIPHRAHWNELEAILQAAIAATPPPSPHVLGGEPAAWRYRHDPTVAWSYSATKHPRPDLEQAPLFLLKSGEDTNCEGRTWPGDHSAQKQSGSTQSCESSTEKAGQAMPSNSSLPPSIEPTEMDRPTSPTNSSTQRPADSYTPTSPADHVMGIEDWAATWHKTVQTICTIIGINGNGGPEEILAELQAKSSESARAKRLQAALGHEGVYIHDATAERAIRAALATATEGSGE